MKQKDLNMMLAEFKEKGGRIRKIKTAQRKWLFDNTIACKGKRVGNYNFAFGLSKFGTKYDKIKF